MRLFGWTISRQRTSEKKILDEFLFVSALLAEATTALKIEEENPVPDPILRKELRRRVDEALDAFRDFRRRQGYDRVHVWVKQMKEIFEKSVES